MAFLDTIKNSITQTSNSALTNITSGAKNRSWTITLANMPKDLQQMQALPEASLTQPQNSVALTVAALCVYPVDKEAAIQMLSFLKGPQPLSGYDQQFLADRFRGKDYIAKSYFCGATPANGYAPTTPYTITVSENPYSYDQIEEGYMTLYLQSGGADSPRPIKLRSKPSTGQWFLWEQMLLSDIRQPATSDSWA